MPFAANSVWQQHKSSHKQDSQASLAQKEAAAKFYQNVSKDSHSWSDWYSCGNGQHEHKCSVCQYTEKVDCEFDAATHLCKVCGESDPTYSNMEIKVDVTSRTTGWLWWKKIIYTAQITAVPVGVEVQKVEYSTDNSSWRQGSRYTSRAPITELYIRVTDSSSTVWNYVYNDGVVKAQL